MKRKLFIFISIFIFYFFYSVNQVKAQFWVQTDTGMMGAAVPGVSCGVPVPPPINGVLKIHQIFLGREMELQGIVVLLQKKNVQTNLLGVYQVGLLMEFLF